MPITITVGTANAAGAARGEKADPCKHALLGNLLATEKEVDVLALQEVIRVEDPRTGQVVHDDIASMKEQSGLRTYKHFYYPYLDSALQPHPGKWLSDIFKPWSQKGYRIYEGTAILIREEHCFWHLLSNDSPGSPTGQVIQWYQPDLDETPAFYCGNRDTCPRTLLMARVRIGGRFILFCCAHLATLKGERTDGNEEIAGKAKAIRTSQIDWIVKYLTDYNAARKAQCGKEFKGQEEEFKKWCGKEYDKYEKYCKKHGGKACLEKPKWCDDKLEEERDKALRDDPIILAGDFNSKADAPELASLRNSSGLQPVLPDPSIQPDYTHREHLIPMDLVWASEGIKKESAEIVDLAELEVSSLRRISDHHPVVATLILP